MSEWMSGPTLFIGGPADGHRYTVVHMGEPFFYMEAPEVTVTDDFSSPFGPEPIRHRYEPHKIAGSGRTFMIYAHQGMTGDDIIGALLRGYREDVKVRA